MLTGDFFKKIIIMRDAPALYYNDDGVLIMSVNDFLLNEGKGDQTWDKSFIWIKGIPIFVQDSIRNRGSGATAEKTAGSQKPKLYYLSVCRAPNDPYPFFYILHQQYEKNK